MMTDALWPCGHARTPENTQRVGTAGDRCKECRRRIARESARRSKASSSCRGERGTTDLGKVTRDWLQSPRHAEVSNDLPADCPDGAGHIHGFGAPSNGLTACPESDDARIKSSMRPHCKHREACKAKTPGKHCNPCSMSAIASDPKIQARRKASFRNRLDTDLEFRAKHAQASADRLMAWRRTEEAKAHFQDRAADIQAPEYEVKRRKAISDHYVGWCPADRREEYLRLRKQIGAAEARRIIEDDLVGTVEHAKRAVANAQIAGRLRHARQQAEAY